MLRSECLPMPVSTIATSALTRPSRPLIAATVDCLAPTRTTPVGVVWAVTWISSSGTTGRAAGAARRGRVGGYLDQLVREDGEDGGIGREILALPVGELGREPLERPAERPIRLDAVPH